VRIRYVSGYANPNSIPKKVRLWMQTRISTLYEHREQIVIGGVVNIPRAFVDGLLDDLKVHKNFA
jgi:5-keto 4-deoxyuronate isomerase